MITYTLPSTLNDDNSPVQVFFQDALFKTVYMYSVQYLDLAYPELSGKPVGLHHWGGVEGSCLQRPQIQAMSLIKAKRFG